LGIAEGVATRVERHVGVRAWLFQHDQIECMNEPSPVVIQALSLMPSGSTPQAPAERLKAFVLEDSFPCLGARSAINTGRAHIQSYGRLGDEASPRLESLCDALAAFSAAYPDPGLAPVTCMALFDDDVADEQDFERRLWCHLQALHRCDRRDHDWAPSVSSDPASSDFSYSIAGRAFFVVGLHPNASRLARRSPVPCIAFNLHDQFEQLRASGKYDRMQRAIRARDVALQGGVNPVLTRFGEASEARQYSGREVNADWGCPFHALGPGVTHER
jgi:FPC/CPF motif-containing protein YcgG